MRDITEFVYIARYGRKNYDGDCQAIFDRVKRGTLQLVNGKIDTLAERVVCIKPLKEKKIKIPKERKVKLEDTFKNKSVFGNLVLKYGKLPEPIVETFSGSENKQDRKSNYPKGKKIA